MGKPRNKVRRPRDRLANPTSTTCAEAADNETARLRKRVRALQAALGEARLKVEEAEARADIAEDEVLATPYRRFVPIEDGGEGRWLPKGMRPDEPGDFFVRFADPEPDTGKLSPFVYKGTAHPNLNHETGALTYDDDSYDVQVYCEWKSRDVRWWSAPIPPPPPLEGENV
jgi:hypothetical protein